MGLLDNLTPEEHDVIEELKERTIKDMSPKMLEDPTIFYRFAKARDFDLKQAEAMLRKHISFRKEYSYDSVITDYEAPEVLRLYTPSSFIGYDKEGCPIRYISIAGGDVKGALLSAKKEDIVKHNIQIMESDLLRLQQQSEKLGKQLTKIVYIYDFDKLTFFKATHKESLELLLLGINIYQDNFPERIKSLYLINCSFYFSLMFSMVKMALAAAILEKINMFGTTGWKEKLREIMDVNELPAFLGGNKTDPDGDPLCKSFIIHGGKIPEHYYLPKSKKVLHLEPGVKKLNVTRFSRESIQFDVNEPGSYLEWQFETKSRDIGFGIFFKDKTWNDSKLIELIPKHRLDTCIEPESGVYKCEKSGTYIMVFDNSYSWLYPKEIYYKASIIPPGKISEL